MAQIIVTTVEKTGDDLLINDVVSIPKDKITISKRTGGFCSMHFDQQYYSDTLGFSTDHLDVHWENVTKPAGVTSNADLFDKLVQLKTP